MYRTLLDQRQDAHSDTIRKPLFKGIDLVHLLLTVSDDSKLFEAGEVHLDDRVGVFMTVVHLPVRHRYTLSVRLNFAEVRSFPEVVPRADTS